MAQTVIAATTQRRRRRGRWLGMLLALLLLLPLGCVSTITPPPPPADPVTVFLLREAMHTGLVLPPTATDPHYVEFGFGDWHWFALGEDQWYRVFPTVLWPTPGALGRRAFGAGDAGRLRAEVSWAELSPVVVSEAKVHELRQRLETDFAAGAAHAVQRADLGFVFVPAASSYWLGHTCADAAAVWFTALDCSVGWSLWRRALRVGGT